MAPARVVVVGDARSVVAPAVTQEQTTGLGWLAHRLGAAWPGAGVGAVDEPDPLGASLVRLCGALNDTAPRGQVPPAWRSAHQLTVRPGRATRGLYRWAGAAVWCVALLVAAVGVSIGRGIQGLRQRIDGARQDAAATLERAASLVPVSADDADPVGLLQGRVAELRRARAALVPEPPVLAELDGLLGVLGDKGALLTELSFGATISSVTLQVPNAETGPRILDELDQLRAIRQGGRVSINWSVVPGRGGGGDGGGQAGAVIPQGFRPYRLTGQWQAVPGTPAARGAP
ncbi:MAG: hypothetical protein C0513_01430 [Isosphaera sp.]|nr:hypothetical protein [Isosphaera sp.]